MNAHNQRITTSPAFEAKANSIIATGMPYTVVSQISTASGDSYEVCFDMLKGGIDPEALRKATTTALSTVAAKTGSMPVKMILMDCHLLATA